MAERGEIERESVRHPQVNAKLLHAYHVAVDGGPVYSSSSPRRCWRPHITHTCIRPNLTFYNRVRGCARGRDSKTPRAITIPISTPLAVRQSQLSRTGHGMTMASILSRQRVVLRSTRWEDPCIMDAGPIPAGWIRAVSCTEIPDHISLRPPCSSVIILGAHHRT